MFEFFTLLFFCCGPSTQNILALALAKYHGGVVFSVSSANVYD